ncbi:MAG TPA: PFL family protein [Actinobacteria bacterium]|nr:PFL family protein [Actinomycetes bacterium]HEX21646.1 PFL family protein [Actinomycetota bacterium]
MLQKQSLDIRTITIGINLLDCIDDNPSKLKQKIYKKITAKAKNLTAVAEEIQSKYGVPIINKRVSVTPIAALVNAGSFTDITPLAVMLDKAAADIGIDFLGGFSALVHKGFTKGDRLLLSSIPKALSSTERVCASIGVATTKAGINMDAVKLLGDIIKDTAAATADRDGVGCAKLVVFCNIPEDNPFMAGAYHGFGEGETVINVGISGPGVIRSAIAGNKSAGLSELAEIIKKTAFKITRVGELVAQEAAQRLGVSKGIVDLSLAPTPTIGDSVAEILEEMGLEKCGTHGTTAALALLNDAVKKGGAFAASATGGLSGAFIPVSEDSAMAEAAADGVLSLSKLEAMTAVCSVGLDMIALPGDISSENISAIIADEMAIGIINNKTTAARLIPVPGKTVGQRADFGGLLGNTPIIATSKYSAAEFINRGGRIPAPLRSLTN